jgi:glycyl-tRNA synthetase beta chain
MSDYFFELLTEEIPAWMLRDVSPSVTQKLRDRLAELVLEIGGVPDAYACVKTVTSTPRRIIFFLSQLPVGEIERQVTVKGPPRKAAYDAGGNPTPALHGFLKKNKAGMEDLVDGGDYVQLLRKVAGRATDEIIAEHVPTIIEGLRWPKMMRWGAGEHASIRPLHSIVSLFDSKHLPITIFGITSGTTTVGHRTLAPGSIEVTSYSNYVEKLELARVVVDANHRRGFMEERARDLAKEVGGIPSVDASIWSQWQYLTEFPGVVRAQFRPEFLDLPEEVLVTVMRVHQKQLPIRDPSGELTHYFLAVLDNEGDPDGNAAYGNSFVTNARFADAKFFYETDRKRPLGERTDQLAHLQFQEKLGNYAEKTKRIQRIASGISSAVGAEVHEVMLAAHLCKADLVTEMVKEFTDLQGKIGGIYAREEGQPESVWQAIYDHYLPLNLDDELPRTISGAIISLADKLDTLAGFFLIGAKPTGSKDPFALRRAAQGVVQILLNRDHRQVRIGIDTLIDLAISAHADGSASSPPADRQPSTVNRQLKDELLAFLAERVRTLLEASGYDFAYDEVAAAMEAGWASSLTDLVERTQAVKAMRSHPNFLSILDSAKRIANITAGHESTIVDRARFENDTERRLDELATLVGSQIDEMVVQKDYRRALESFAAMAPELESFFDEVMVMVDDEAVRKNRMSLLRKIGGAALKIADVTKIVVDRRDYRPS